MVSYAQNLALMPLNLKKVPDYCNFGIFLSIVERIRHPFTEKKYFDLKMMSE